MVSVGSITEIRVGKTIIRKLSPATENTLKATDYKPTSTEDALHHLFNTAITAKGIIAESRKEISILHATCISEGNLPFFNTGMQAVKAVAGIFNWANLIALVESFLSMALPGTGNLIAELIALFGGLFPAPTPAPAA
jgi:hypothetical protein